VPRSEKTGVEAWVYLYRVTGIFLIVGLRMPKGNCN
jgi:hypothetical protein